MGVDGQLHAPAALPPGKRPSTHCTGGLVGPRAGLEGAENLTLTFDPRTVQLVASRYTHWAIPAHALLSSYRISSSYTVLVPKGWTQLLAAKTQIIDLRM
jgi:hypothetical protein